MQAEAAKIKPSVLMNPILLKPTNDIGSQVIVNGEVLGNMKAVDYFKYKKKLIPDIIRAYNKLDEEYDIIVIEGAGSPAEINLKSEDIVNMGMAKMAKAPVILAGDIDRGGVFAQLMGTVMLLEEDEKSLIKGTIINKFRGDKTILQPGVDMLEDMSKVPVVGVIPYMNVDIDDEDSLSERFTRNTKEGFIDIAVIRLPRISNFTDFNVLEGIEGVSLRYVKTPGELNNPDMIIIPGTKNTMEDLLWMRQCGLEAKILKEASMGKIIFGICGGYQMLGETLSDPYKVESGGEIKGMNLLPMKTVFNKEKIRTRVVGKFNEIEGKLKTLSKSNFEGYEIHMGSTKILKENINLTKLDNKNLDGAYLNNVYGTYVHGIFDSEEVVKGLIASLFKEKNLDYSDILTFDHKKYKEKQYDILAKTVRENIDMKKIYEILEAGV